MILLIINPMGKIEQDLIGFIGVSFIIFEFISFWLSVAAIFTLIIRRIFFPNWQIDDTKWFKKNVSAPNGAR